MKARVTIKGLSPLLMHSFPMDGAKGIEKMTPAQQAERAAYRTPDKALYIPGTAIQRCLVNGAKFSKGKGRATLQGNVAACVLVTPEYALLGQESYAIDSRPVVVPATKGRVVRHRPRFDHWEVSFDLEWDEELLSEKEIRQVIDDAGKRVGLLDFRPQNKGPFGRFVVTQWVA